MKPDAVDRWAAERRALLDAVLQARAAASAAMRAAAFKGDAMPAALEDYVRKVRNQSYRVTDDDLKRLVGAGYSEDIVFEVTIASALGAADERMQAGLRALAGD